MKVADSMKALNERKENAFNDPEHKSEGEPTTIDAYRLVVVGLDLDVVEVEDNAIAVARYAMDAIVADLISPPLALKMLALDLFIAGVYYERERSRATASGVDHG